MHAWRKYKHLSNGVWKAPVSMSEKASVYSYLLRSMAVAGYAPSFDHCAAEALAALGVPAFACTPEAFPGLIAAAIDRRDLAAWAGEAGLVTR